MTTGGNISSGPITTFIQESKARPFPSYAADDQMGLQSAGPGQPQDGRPIQESKSPVRQVYEINKVTLTTLYFHGTYPSVSILKPGHPLEG